jgi:hypothetical protein
MVGEQDHRRRRWDLPNIQAGLMMQRDAGMPYKVDPKGANDGWH